MTTAFQPTAFQNNAFQIDFVDRGAGKGRGSGRKKRRYKIETGQELIDLIEQYKSLKDIPEIVEKQIISAVNPFVYPQTSEEAIRYSRASYLFDAIPPPDRVDFDMLLQNSISLERLKSALEKMRMMQEEEFCLLMLLSTN